MVAHWAYVTAAGTMKRLAPTQLTLQSCRHWLAAALRARGDSADAAERFVHANLRSNPRALASAMHANEMLRM